MFYCMESSSVVMSLMTVSLCSACDSSLPITLQILMLLASASAQRPASGKREATQQLTSSGDDEQGEEPEDDEEPEEVSLIWDAIQGLN